MVINPNQPQQQDFLGSLISPFTNSMSLMGDLTNFAGNSQNFMGNNQNPINILGGALSGSTFRNSNFTPEYSTPDQWDQFTANPFGKELQNAAGMASFLPVVANPVLGGALAGGLSSFGNQDLRNGLDVGNLALGAGLGAATGGIMHAGSNFLGDKLGGLLGGGSNELAGAVDNTLKPGQQETQTMIDKLLSNDANKNLSPMQQAGINRQFKALGMDIPSIKEGGLDFQTAQQNHFDNINQALKTLKPNNSTEINASNISGLADPMGELRQNVIAMNPFSNNATDMINKLAPELARTQKISIGDAAEILKSNILKVAGDVNNPEQALNANIALNQGNHFDLYNAYKNEANKMEKIIGTGGNLNDNLQAKGLISNYSNDLIKQNNPAYKQLNNTYGSLYNQVDNIIKQQNAGGAGIPLTKRQIQSSIAPKLNQMLGKGQEALGGVMGNGLNLGGSSPQEALLRNLGINTGMNALGGNSKQNNQAPQAEQTDNMPPSLEQAFGGSMGENSPEMQQSRQFVQQTLTSNPKTSISEIRQALAYNNMPDPFSKPSQSDQLKMKQIDNVYQGLGELKQIIAKNPNQVGNIGGGPIGDLLGAINPGQRNQIKTMIKQIGPSVSRYVGKDVTDNLNMLQSPQDLANAITSIQHELAIAYLGRGGSNNNNTDAASNLGF